MRTSYFMRLSVLGIFVVAFRLAETDRSTPVRFLTVQPTQTLGLINSEFLNRPAEVLAARLRKEAGDDLRQQIHLVPLLVTHRNRRALK